MEQRPPREKEVLLPLIKKQLGEDSGKSDEDIENALIKYMELAQSAPEKFHKKTDAEIVNEVVSQLKSGSGSGGRRRSSKSSKKQSARRRRSSKARKSRKVRKSRSTRRK